MSIRERKILIILLRDYLERKDAFKFGALADPYLREMYELLEKMQIELREQEEELRKYKLSVDQTLLRR